MGRMARLDHAFSEASGAMARLRLGFCAVTLAAALLVPLSSALAAEIAVSVAGVTSAQGHVRVSLCTRETFLTSNCPFEGSAPAEAGVTVIHMTDIPPGRYAIQAFDDDLDAGRVHFNLLGLPRERIGFSNDAPLHLRGPRFDEASFDVGEPVRKLRLRLRRLAPSLHGDGNPTP